MNGSSAFVWVVSSKCLPVQCKPSALSIREEIASLGECFNADEEQGTTLMKQKSDRPTERLVMCSQLEAKFQSLHLHLILYGALFVPRLYSPLPSSDIPSTFRQYIYIFIFFLYRILFSQKAHVTYTPKILRTQSSYDTVCACFISIQIVFQCKSAYHTTLTFEYFWSFRVIYHICAYFYHNSCFLGGNVSDCLMLLSSERIPYIKCLLRLCVPQNRRQRTNPALDLEPRQWDVGASVDTFHFGILEVDGIMAELCRNRSRGTSSFLNRNHISAASPFVKGFLDGISKLTSNTPPFRRFHNR